MPAFPKELTAGQESPERRTGTLCGSARICIRPVIVFIDLHINDICNCSNKINFHLLADDTNILYADKNLQSLEQVLNTGLHKLYVWLTSNKLTLNPKISNFVIFRPFQKKLTFQPKISIFDSERNKKVQLDCKDSVKYLGLLIGCNFLVKTVLTTYYFKNQQNSKGILAKLGHLVPLGTLLNIYQPLIVPYFNLRTTCLGPGL